MISWNRCLCQSVSDLLDIDISYYSVISVPLDLCTFCYEIELVNRKC